MEIHILFWLWWIHNTKQKQKKTLTENKSNRPQNIYKKCFFSKKNILIPNVAEKNILILVEEKNK